MCLKSSLKCWVPDLCQHGDIHPNPGPRRKNRNLTEFTILNMNVQSTSNAWRVLDDITPNKFPAITLQECRMSQPDVDAFQHKAKKKGYLVHWQPGQTSVARWNTPWQNGRSDYTGVKVNFSQS